MFKKAPGQIFSWLFVIAVSVVCLIGINNTQKNAEAEGRRIAEESIRRAVVTCYAIEGSYPESYAYLVKNYGLQIDESKYIVHYQVTASNVLPDITVLEK